MHALRSRTLLALALGLLGCTTTTTTTLDGDKDGDGIKDSEDGDDDNDGILDEDDPDHQDGSGDGDGDGNGNSDGDSSGVNVGQSSCGAPSVGGASPVISDFEGSASEPELIAQDGRAGFWYGFPEAATLSVGSGGADGSSRALTIKATAALGEEAGAGVALNARGARSCAHNATAYTGIAFWVRGEGVSSVPMRVAQGWTTPVAEGGTCLEDCYNHHFKDIAVTGDWTRVEVPFSQFEAAGWGQTVPFDPRQITQITWGLPQDAAFTLQIDGLAFLPGGTVDESLPPGYGDGDGPPDGAGETCKPDSMIVDNLETPDYSSSLWYTMYDGGTVNSSLIEESDGGHAIHAMGSGASVLTVARTTDDVGRCFTSDAGGLKFRVRSEKARDLWVRVRLEENTPASEGGTCAFTEQQCESGSAQCCYDYHRAKVTLRTGWQDVELPFSRFAQEGFGKAINLSLATALGLEFEFQSANGVDVWLDDVGLLPPEDTGPIGNPCADNAGGNVPFGSKPVAYVGGARKPSGISDQAVREAYNQWKSSYVEAACGGYLVNTLTDTGAYTVSEAMGYGMILTAFMNDKEYFDGMWRVTRVATSPVVSEFMSWRLSTSCSSATTSDRQSATDGDMDIAYALLLADRQWGSGLGIDYRGEANAIIRQLAQWTLSSDQSFIKLGDWVHQGSGVLGTTTRPSDFMPDHFRSFLAVTGDQRWQTVLDEMYATLANVQNQMDGLVPDFVVNADSSPAPAPGEILEQASDGTYAVNACRVPWRLGVDYVINGESRADGMLEWLSGRASTLAGGVPGNFVGKYWGDGNYVSRDTQGALFYTGPLGVGAMAGADQGWLDSLYSDTRGRGRTVYYQDTLRVLSLITMTGNWWSPHKVTCN